MKQMLAFVFCVLIVGCGKPISSGPIESVESEDLNIRESRSFTVKPQDYAIIGGGNFDSNIMDMTIEVELRVIGDNDQKIELIVLPVQSALFQQNPTLSDHVYRSGEVNRGTFTVQLPNRYTYVLNNDSLDEKNVSVTVTRTIEPK